jgi:hypothetical protein
MLSVLRLLGGGVLGLHGLMSGPEHLDEGDVGCLEWRHLPTSSSGCPSRAPNWMRRRSARTVKRAKTSAITGMIERLHESQLIVAGKKVTGSLRAGHELSAALL